MAVSRQPTVEDVGRAPVFPLPKVVAEQADHRATAVIVGVGDRSPEKRVHSKRAEKVSTDPTGVCVANFAAHRQIGAVGAVSEGSREDILAVAHLLPNWIRKREPSSVFMPSSTSCSGWLTGSVFRMTALIRLKMAVLAPMPRASDRIAVVANPGLERKALSA
jgi:hypothetical protein